MNNKEKNYCNLALVWYKELCSSRRVFSFSICVVFQIILSLILFIFTDRHSLGSANKTYCHNDKFPLFFIPTASLLTHSSDPLARSPQAQMWQPHIWKAACSITQHYVTQWPVTISIQGIFIFIAYISSKSPPCYLGGKILGSPDSLQGKN